ncbi:PaaI family thioesterase [Actinomycetospora straminea]|uniref:Hotdog fold thioesterase n=1 Tax=Actinomycetospora straminea TaxID=663607 RepID=A0ABP9DUI5_9PSEU|nr:hotdog fold thioesterase [Actinomycetospora straminea]MDD7932428.1 hotdog fold thioesterase [Actinomycetospora straminea]
MTSSSAPESAAVPDIEVQYPDEQLAARMGIEITAWDPDRVVGTMPVTGNRQPFGLLHGGANGVLAETLGSTAAALHGWPERMPVGLELSCTHHRSALDGKVTGVCTPLSVGRTIGTFEIVVSDDEGRRVCTAKLTCVYRSRPPGSGG